MRVMPIDRMSTADTVDMGERIRTNLLFYEPAAATSGQGWKTIYDRKGFTGLGLGCFYCFTYYILLSPLRACAFHAFRTFRTRFDSRYRMISSNSCQDYDKRLF
jgi:hypothetical protein